MVIKRFKCMGAFVVALSAAIIAQADSGAPAVQALRVSQHSPSHLLPCQRITAVLEIELEREASPAAWHRIVRTLSQAVRVNDRVFKNRLGSMSLSNDACAFYLVPPAESNAKGEAAPSHKTAMVVADLFANLLDRTCLFEDPMQYEIEFALGPHTTTIGVLVDEPDPADAKIVSELKDWAVLRILVDPTDMKDAPPDTIAMVQRLAREDSGYAKMLSLAVGIGGISKLPLPDKWSEEDYRNRDLDWARQTYAWLDPHCSEEIKSPIEALAAFKCGLAANILATGAREIELSARRDQLWSAVARSSMAYGEARNVFQILEATEAQQAPRR